MDLFMNNEQDGRMPDSDYMNHPGFIGNWITGSASSAENKRYRRAVAEMMKRCQIRKPSQMTCDELSFSWDCLNDEKARALAMGTGGRGARRVRNRAIKAVKTLQSMVMTGMRVQGCATGTTTTTTTPTGVVDFSRLTRRMSCPNLAKLGMAVRREQKRKRCRISSGGFIGGMFGNMPRPPKPPRPRPGTGFIGGMLGN